MRRGFLSTLVVSLLWVAEGFPQDFSGTYTLETSDGLNTLSLTQDAQGNVTGTLKSDDGVTFDLEGVIKETFVAGIITANERASYFKAQLVGQGLKLSVIPLNGENQPDYSQAREFVFTRQGGGAAPREPASLAPPVEGRPADNPLARPAASGSQDPLLGTFADDRLRVELKGGGGKYQGQMQLQGQTFPLSARSTDGRTLKGTFASGGNNFEFSATLEGATLTLSTGGATYRLRRHLATHPAATPANPLAGGKSAAARPASATSGNEVNDPYLGVRFTVPQGWKHEKRQSIYVLGHTTTPGMILIMPHTYNNTQEVLASAHEPLYQADDGQLVVEGAPQTLADNLLAADYGGVIEGRQAKGRLACILSPHGGGFFIMAGTDAGSYGPQYAQWAEGIARSMKFSKPQAPPEVAMWRERLSGHRLAYLTSGGSSDPSGAYAWSDQKDIYLCSNGTFQASGGFSGSIGTANASGWSQDSTGPQSGQWAIIGQAGQPALELRHSAGQREAFVLSTDGSKTFLNGVRYFVVENNVCP